MRTEIFLAGRYLKPQRNAVSLITLLSLLGVTLGVAVLIVVLAVMTGFTDMMKEKIVETQAHFQVRPSWGGIIYNAAETVKAIEDAGGKAAPVIQAPAMVQVPGNNQLDLRILMLGVEAKDLKKNLFTEDTIQEGKLSLEQDEVIISTLMADRWRVGIGSKVLLYTHSRLTNFITPKEGGGFELNKEPDAYLPSEFRVSGIYEVGKYDFDNSVLFVGIADAADMVSWEWGWANTIFGWGPDAFHQDELVKRVAKAVEPHRVSTWQEENKQFLDVLQVEKNMMFFLLIFIVLVAAFSIMNTLITSVYQKTREIGILKALGASDPSVSTVFVLQGLMIGLFGSLSGILLGWLVIKFRNEILVFASKTFGIDLFPRQFYYFNELPAHIVASDVIIIAVSSVVLCTIGALLPAVRAALLDPAKALRYE